MTWDPRHVLRRTRNVFHENKFGDQISGCSHAIFVINRTGKCFADRPQTSIPCAPSYLWCTNAPSQSIDKWKRWKRTDCCCFHPQTRNVGSLVQPWLQPWLRRSFDRSKRKLLFRAMLFCSYCDVLGALEQRGPDIDQGSLQVTFSATCQPHVQNARRRSDTCIIYPSIANHE